MFKCDKTQCAVEAWLHLLGHRWTAPILWLLERSDLQFGQICDRLPGLSRKVLTERLSQLRAAGLVARSASASFPRRVSYGLTDEGRAIVSILHKLEAQPNQ